MKICDFSYNGAVVINMERKNCPNKPRVTAHTASVSWDHLLCLLFISNFEIEMKRENFLYNQILRLGKIKLGISHHYIYDGRNEQSTSCFKYGTSEIRHNNKLEI